MRSMFRKNLSTSGKSFSNERTGVSFLGILVLNQGKPRIDVECSVDINSTNWIINSIGEKLYITDIVSLSEYYKSCHYISEYEYNQSNKNNLSFTINATTIENSIIGTQSNATINMNEQIQKLRDEIAESSSKDKDELLQIISLLEDIKSSNKPVPKGIFSKFSAVMERNSWISGSIASFLLSLFLNP